VRQFIIQGGIPLKGEVEISGAKNAAAAILAAAMLCDGVCVIDNLPYISDVVVMAELIEYMGAKVELSPSGRITIDASSLENKTPPEHMVSRMRASSYLMGVLLGRWKKANVPPPGGCCIGARPIDLHLKGFRALGANIDEGNLVSIEADELIGGEVHAEASVGTTINIMFAACRARGNTTIYSAAKEPHVVDTANFLNNMGARIKGAGTDTIRITGVNALHGCNYTIIPDQIETGTYMIMAAATHGDVIIKNCIPIHMESVSAKLSDAGALITEGDDWIRVCAPGQLKAINLKTMTYPGYPTDLQQPISAMLTMAQGTSVITETIFEQRYRHLEEMRRMGAKARVEDRIAIIEGVDKLYGRCVEARDLRAGAALITAGLMAEGTTTILGGRYIERGYERIDQKLQGLGARIVVEDK
jgi:UDP-N-acetylglucosamine 1-carboxyvinyltransferase